MLTETAFSIERAQALEAAERTMAALQLRILAANNLALEPKDRKAYVDVLRQALTTAESTRDALRDAISEAERAARADRDRALREARADTSRQARDVVRALLPLVRQIDRLNGELGSLRERVGYSSEITPSFRPYLPAVENWLKQARQFVGDGE